METFFAQENRNEKIIPLFIKKIEDLDRLLDTTERDIKQKTQIKQDNISTLDKLNIKNFFSIENITIDNLKNEKEVYIVGENGDGKSLFLQALTIALVGANKGEVIDFLENQKEYKLLATNSDGIKYTEKSKNNYNNILAYGSSRNNYCSIKEDEQGYMTLFKANYDLNNPIKWLQYLDYKEKSNETNIISSHQAKELIIELLNRDITIDITSDEVVFTEKKSKVSFNQLSAGYKNIIVIICDLIKRFSEGQTVSDISQFQGIVLIDEVELHLHPKWQYTFIKKIREKFPLIQFIVTTHSSTVILGASQASSFYRIYKKDGLIQISKKIDSATDFINDIQTDIFNFDINEERIKNPDIKRQKKAKKALLALIKQDYS